MQPETSARILEAQSTNSVNPELQSKGPHARNRNAPDSNRAGERLAHGAQLARHRLRFKSEMHTDSQMWQERDRETKGESESARERERETERERDKAREGGREGEKGLDLLRDLVGMFGPHGYWAESKPAMVLSAAAWLLRRDLPASRCALNPFIKTPRLCKPLFRLS